MDDEQPSVPKSALGRPLETMSASELHAYINALEREVERVRAELAKKEDVRRAAEALFRQYGD